MSKDAKEEKINFDLMRDERPMFWIDEKTMITMALIGDTNRNGVCYRDLTEIVNMIKAELISNGISDYMITSFPQKTHYTTDFWRQSFTNFNDRYDFAMYGEDRIKFIVKVLFNFKHRLMQSFDLSSEAAMGIIDNSIINFSKREQENLKKM